MRKRPTPAINRRSTANKKVEKAEVPDLSPLVSSIQKRKAMKEATVGGDAMLPPQLHNINKKKEDMLEESDGDDYSLPGDEDD